MSDDDVNGARETLNAKRELGYCSICIDEKPARFVNETRDPSLILVVKDSRDVSAMKISRNTTGHIMSCMAWSHPWMAWDPMISISQEFAQSLDGWNSYWGHYLIICDNEPREATSMYVSRVLKPAGIQSDPFGTGASSWSRYQYADEVTLLRAIENRTEL